MSLTIHLLGSPRIRRDGTEPRVRGHKPWGLLAYLLRAEFPPTRDHVVSLLFADADDPLGALRWNLSELRRALGPSCVVGGDPLSIVLPPDAVVDVDVLTRGTWAEALGLPGLERELLEGLAFRGCAAFEVWLLGERRHLAAAAEGMLREGAMARLASGDPAAAATLATRLVALNPLDENFQALLVRSLAASGNAAGAALQVERCTEVFRRELGVEPSAALREAAEPPVAAPTGSRAAARAQLEAGRAAVGAGAVEAGVDCLRRAVTEARATGDADLEAEALVALGGALVHAVRGHDEEGATTLHEALGLATRFQLHRIAAAAARELGYVEFLRARYARAEGWVKRAIALADEPAEQSRARCVLGSTFSDVAEYETAIEELRISLALAEQAGETRQQAYTLSMLGRAHLLRDELGPAAAALDKSLVLARRDGWTAFVAWPEALRADVDVARGDVDAAAERYEYAFALGCQLGDPCWEGVAARGLGVVAAARGEVKRAVEWLTDARTRCTRLPDAYVWVEAYALDALCAVAVEHDLAQAPAWIDELAALAARTRMREFEVRAYGYRATLGDESAAEVARVLSRRIDNPALAAPGRDQGPERD